MLGRSLVPQTHQGVQSRPPLPQIWFTQSTQHAYQDVQGATPSLPTCTQSMTVTPRCMQTYARPHFPVQRSWGHIKVKVDGNDNDACSATTWRPGRLALGVRHRVMDALGIRHGVMDALGVRHGVMDAFGVRHGVMDALGVRHGVMDASLLIHGSAFNPDWGRNSAAEVLKALLIGSCPMMHAPSLCALQLPGQKLPAPGQKPSAPGQKLTMPGQQLTGTSQCMFMSHAKLQSYQGQTPAAAHPLMQGQPALVLGSCR